MGFELPGGDVVGQDSLPDPSEGAGFELPGGEVVTAPSVTERVLGGTLLGLSRNPLTGFFVNRIMEQIPDLEPKQYLGDMESRLHNSRLSDVFEIVGEWGPDLAAGIGTYALGRAAARTALTAAARRGILGAGAGRAFTAYALDAAGSTAPALKPGLMRLAEMVGGNVAMGGYATGRELAAGEDLQTALKSGGISTALGLGLEGAFAGVGRLTRYGRRAPTEQVRHAVRQRSAWLKKEEAAQKVRITDLNQRVTTLKGTLAQAQALYRAATATPIAGAPGPQVARAIAAAQRRVGLAEGRLTRAEKRLRGSKAILGILRTERKTPVNYFDYTRAQPFDSNGKLPMARTLLRRAAVPPEDQIGQQGIVLTETLKDLVNAELEIVPNMAAASLKSGQLYHKAADVLGISVAGRPWLQRGTRASQPLIKALNKSPLFTQMFNIWETQGDQAVDAWLQSIGRGHKLGEARELFKDVRGVRELFDRLVQLGGESALTPAEMARMGVVNFLPHVMEYKSDAQLISQLATSMFGGNKFRASEYLTRGRLGLRHFGSIDHQRKVAGSLAQKVGQGMPFVADPIEGIERYMSALSRRLAYGKRFGINGELRETAGRLAVQEGADPQLVDEVLNQFFNIKYVDAATEAALLKLRNFETATKMSLAVIPNFTQPINAALATGVTNTLRSSMQALPGVRKNLFLRGYGMNQAMFELIDNSFVEGRPRGGPFDRFLEAMARGTLRYSGFEKVEDFNRLVSAVAAGRRLKKDLARAVSGRLRGNELNRARRTFRMAGLNLDDAVRRYRALSKTHGVVELVGDGPNALFTASKMTRDGFVTGMGQWDQGIWRMVQQTQFIPSAVRRPLYWNTPAGRVAFQFKNFALNQFRLLRDSVFAEAAHGNITPAAVFLGLYPIVGEGVRDVQTALRGKERGDNLVTRYLDNMMAVGGFAIAGDALMAARWGRLTNWLVGPAPTDAVMFAEALVQTDMDQLRRQIQAMPAYRAATALAYGGAAAGVGAKLTADQILEWIDQEEAEGGEPAGDYGANVPTLREFAQRGKGGQ